MQRILNPYMHTCCDNNGPCNACDEHEARLVKARAMLESLAVLYRELPLDARMAVKQTMKEVSQ